MPKLNDILLNSIHQAYQQSSAEEKESILERTKKAWGFNQKYAIHFFSHPVEDGKKRLKACLEKSPFYIEWCRDPGVTYTFHVRFQSITLNESEIDEINKRVRKKFGGIFYFACIQKLSHNHLDSQENSNTLDRIVLVVHMLNHRHIGCRKEIRNAFSRAIDALQQENILSAEKANAIKERLGISKIPSLSYLALKKVQSLVEVTQEISEEDLEKEFPNEIVKLISGPGF